MRCSQNRRASFTRCVGEGTFSRGKSKGSEGRSRTRKASYTLSGWRWPGWKAQGGDGGVMGPVKDSGLRLLDTLWSGAQQHMQPRGGMGRPQDGGHPAPAGGFGAGGLWRPLPGPSAPQFRGLRAGGCCPDTPKASLGWGLELCRGGGTPILLLGGARPWKRINGGRTTLIKPRGQSGARRGRVGWVPPVARHGGARWACWGLCPHPGSGRPGPGGGGARA